MGQKVHPYSARLGIIRNWSSNWFAKGKYVDLFEKDCKLRKYLNERLKHAGLASVVLERVSDKLIVTIHTARPGVVIGKKGNEIDKLKADLSRFAGCEVSLNISEVRKPDVDAKLVADGIAQQLEKRVSFRRAIKRAMQSAQRQGALGIRVNCSGRLGGAEIARMEWYREGQVPLHTFRADIDYADSTAHTTYGSIGVKVWIYKGEIFDTSGVFLPKKVGARAEV